MAFELERNTAAPRWPDTPARPDDGSFTVSSEPVIAERAHGGDAETSSELPRSYGAELLYLLPRDPHSLFAYWDIDWERAFSDGTPPERKVYLRILGINGVEEAKMEIEPMAGSCYVTVPKGDAAYTAEVGFQTAANDWNVIASSAAAQSPPDQMTTAAAPDFATVPFHLSFQRIVDSFRIAKHESQSITALLSELRQRASASEARTLTPEENELMRAIEAAQAKQPQPKSGETPDLWVRQKAERILGFGGTSPTAGFGGASPTGGFGEASPSVWPNR